MIFLVEVPIYRVHVYFIFGNDREGAEKWLKRKKLYGEHAVSADTLDWAFKDEHQGITCYSKNKNRILVHVDSVDNHKSIGHEIFHVVMTIGDWVGMTPVPANEEAFAYLVGYITDEVYIKIKGHGKETT